VGVLLGSKGMNNTTIVETQKPIDGNYDREIADLMKIAGEKPTLRMIKSPESKMIEEWEQLYPELWLFIEVTREDVHQIYEGKLIATAENSIEFLDLGREYDEKQIVNYRTQGVSLFERPLLVPV
jgi:hypothetical protein